MIYSKNKRESLFKLPALVVCLSLLIPLFVCFFHVQSLNWPHGVEWIPVFGWTFIQAVLTTFFSLFLGLLGSRGLLFFRHKRHYPLLEAVALMPAFLPPLLFCVPLINLTEILFPFPFGLSALVFVQSMVSIGLCSLTFSRTLEKEASELSQWSHVHGISSWKFLKASAKTILKKDMKIMGVFVFTNAFTSLSFALLIAGSPHISLEFFIYEKLKTPALWPQALTLILIQMVFIFSICLWGFAFKQGFFQKNRKDSPLLYLLPSKQFILIPLLPPLLCLAGLVLNFNYAGIEKLFRLGFFLFTALGSSLFLGVSVGALTVAGLSLMTLSFQNLRARKFALAYSNPGTSLTGFTFLILALPLGIYFDWIFGLSLLLFPFIYRFQGEILLEKLEGQVETARLFGAGWGLIFRDILWPQCYKGFFLCGGIAGFWACGEFAYTLIVSKGKWNLALIVYDLFSSYRINMALVAGWLLLLTSGLVLLFWSVGATSLMKQIISKRQSFTL